MLSRGGRRRLPQIAFRHRPIFKLQPRHTGELALVCRHEQIVTPARLCGDEKIIGANGRAGPLQSGANIARLLGVRGLERQDLDRASEKVANAPRVAVWPRALAAPYQSSNNTMEEIASGWFSRIALSIRARTGEVRSLSAVMIAFVSRQIIP
jgi:hypothetical protein